MNSAAPLLEVSSLSKHFGAVRALHDVSMKVHPGEVVALAGDNGAGKTTLIKAISGVFRPTSGEVRLKGEQVSFSTPQEARDNGIETIYQDLALADNLTIGGNIFLGREPMRRAFGFLPVLDRKKMADAARTTMAMLDFHVSRTEAPVSNFSGGQRQAVAIGRAVYWDAQILIMDEPTAALGVHETEMVANLIRELKAQGLGIFLVSHDTREMMGLCDRVSVMKNGRLVGTERVSDLTEDDILTMIILGRNPRRSV